MKKIVVGGERFFMKFEHQLSYFDGRAAEIGAKIVPVYERDDKSFTRAIRDCCCIIVIDRKITKEMINALTDCRLILALSVGYDCVDVEAATRKGIPVCNVPAYCTDEVAGHTLTLILAVARKIHILLPVTKKGNWDYNIVKPIYNFKDKILGIIGLGKIGRALVPKAMGIGMKICAYDPYLADDIFNLMGVKRYYELEELLKESDYISIHAPLTPETHHMIDEKTFSLMKPSCVLVNTARGKIIDESALYNALSQGIIAGAGLDVLEKEPPGERYSLFSLPNLIVTPHIAWYSEESFNRSMEQGMNEVIRVLEGKRPRGVVNPQIFGK